MSWTSSARFYEGMEMPSSFVPGAVKPHAIQALDRRVPFQDGPVMAGSEVLARRELDLIVIRAGYISEAWNGHSPVNVRLSVSMTSTRNACAPFGA